MAMSVWEHYSVRLVGPHHGDIGWESYSVRLVGPHHGDVCLGLLVSDW